MFGVQDRRSHHPLCLTFILDKYVLYWRSLGGALITWETVSCSGSNNDFFDESSNRACQNWMRSLTVARQDKPVAGYPEVCIHEVPPVMSPVMSGDGMADCVHLGYGSTCCSSLHVRWIRRAYCSRCSFLHVFGL